MATVYKWKQYELETTGTLIQSNTKVTVRIGYGEYVYYGDTVNCTEYRRVSSLFSGIESGMETLPVYCKVGDTVYKTESYEVDYSTSEAIITGYPMLEECSKGNVLLGEVTSTNSGEYPSNGAQDGYWYVYVGEESAVGLYITVGGIQRKLTAIPAMVDGVMRETSSLLATVDDVAREVFASSLLPIGYTQLEYIQSNGTQHINTGLTASGNTCVEMDLHLNGTSGAHGPYGAWDSGSTNKFIPLFDYASNKGYLNYGTQQKQVVSSYFKRAVLKQDKNIVYFNDEVLATFNKETFTSTNTMFLFAWNNAGSVANHATMALYSCRIYDNGTIVRDYIPCINPNGEVGMYDLVTAEFYPNVGAGEFTYALAA